jgi:hypothetical protein
MASFLEESGHDAEVAPDFERAQTLIDELLAQRTDLPLGLPKEVRRIAVWLDTNFGETALEHGKLDQAYRSFDRAIDLLKPVIQVTWEGDPDPHGSDPPRPGDHRPPEG